MSRAAKVVAGALVVAILVSACATNSGGGLPSPVPSLPSPSPSLPSPSPPSPASLPSPSPSPSPSTSTDSGSASKSGDSARSGKRGGESDSEGGSAVPETPAPGTVAKTAERGGSAQTPQERRAEVDGKLDSSLGSFDEQLKREQQRTAQERDARASGRAGASGTDGGASGSDGDLDGDPRRTASRSGRDRAGDLRSERRTGESGGEPEGAPGEGAALPGKGGGGAVSGRVIPDGSDDDIIARRLRKAAETETDPELKEKLWKEYIDYKSNARSGR